MNVHSVAAPLSRRRAGAEPPIYRQRVRIVSRSNSATLTTRQQDPQRRAGRARSAPSAARRQPERAGELRDEHAVSGMMISTPNCCAVRASLTRDDTTIAACSDTSAAAGATSTISSSVRALTIAAATPGSAKQPGCRRSTAPGRSARSPASGAARRAPWPTAARTCVTGVASSGSSVRACFSPTTACAASAIAPVIGVSRNSIRNCWNRNSCTRPSGSGRRATPATALTFTQVGVVAEALPGQRRDRERDAERQHERHHGRRARPAAARARLRDRSSNSFPNSARIRLVRHARLRRSLAEEVQVHVFERRHLRAHFERSRRRPRRARGRAPASRARHRAERSDKRRPSTAARGVEATRRASRQRDGSPATRTISRPVVSRRRSAAGVSRASSRPAARRRDRRAARLRRGCASRRESRSRRRAARRAAAGRCA